MGDQLALWSLIVNLVGLVGIAATLVLMTNDWRANRGIHWLVDTSMAVNLPNRDPRYRRIVQLVWSAPTTVGEVRVFGAKLIGEVDPVIGNRGNSAGVVAAGQPHIMLAESDDWEHAWVWVIYLRPRSRTWIAAWQPLAVGESGLPAPVLRSWMSALVYRYTWRLRPVPRVGPGGASAALIRVGPHFGEDARRAGNNA